MVDRLAQQINGRRELDIDWIEDLEARLARRFPASFGSLISRYEFAPFDLGGISFFGSTRQAAEPSQELRLAMFDPALGGWLAAKGYIQIGRPDTGDYDAVCFDTNQKKSNRESPIVRIDHESVFCHSRVRVTQLLAPSFYKLIEGEVKVSPPAST